MPGADPKLIGGIAVTVAIFFFGTQAIFVKSEAILKARVDPFLVVCYFSVGVFFCGALIAIVLSGTGVEGGFEWTIDGLLVSLLYAPGKILLLWSARVIGVGLCTGVVSCTASITAFFTGVLILGNPVPSWTNALIGLSMLIIGAVGMSLTRVQSVQQRLAPGLYPASDEIAEDQPYKLMRAQPDLSGIDIEMADLKDGVHSVTEAIAKVQVFDQKELSTGLAAAAIAGVFLGCQGVPLSNNASVPLRDAATFMMMQLLWTLVLLLPLLQIKYNATIARGESWDWHRDVALVPAMAGGVCFSVAFGGQLVAILALTASVGLPLTQLNLVVAGLWGIFYFEELKGRVLVTYFFLGAAIAVGGAPLI